MEANEHINNNVTSFEEVLNKEITEFLARDDYEFFIDELVERATFDENVEYGLGKYMDEGRYSENKLNAISFAALETVLSSEDTIEALKSESGFESFSSDMLAILYASAVARVYQKAEAKHNAGYNTDNDYDFEDYVSNHRGYSSYDIFTTVTGFYVETKKREAEEKSRL